ncbi:hypothetical protein GF323_06165 [Candidatus Woesearchaeota archaeon]|nr:hypothetical protein [Candidatus Woesearchaeota archaeon]
MSEIKKEVYKDLLNKYKSRIEHELGGKNPERAPKTKDYTDFKREIIPPHMNLYEKACNLSEKILNIKPDRKKSLEVAEAILSAHLNITPAGSTSFSILAPLILILVGGIISYVVFGSLFFVLVILLVAAISINPLAKLPVYIANYWRLKASNQMVLCVFYVVTYMRHTSNLENAIQFASEHLAPPLSLDLKKIIWDVETEKYESLKESLDAYLNSWRKYNMEFVESFHLIESSLLEPNDTRRLESLDRALDVILSETYEKMLHYAHNLKSPITMLHMLGIILPILGLVILPLVVSFMQDVTWLHLMFFYNIIIPLAVFFIGKMILSKRPTGYGDTDISEEIPSLRKYKNIIIKLGKAEIKINPVFVSTALAAFLFIVGISPILLNILSPGFDIPLDPEGNFKLIGYEADKTTGNLVGPYGLGASLLSLSITLAFGLGLGLYFSLRSKNIIKIREKTKKLEDEFASALFQLGNRLGDNMPAEIAFSKVAAYMPNTNSGKFFRMVSINIQKLGMSVSQAIFNPKYGALLFFPSRIIESAMKVLIESVKKGPKVAAQALTNIARYIKEIHRVNERLRDLMADIISSMTTQIKFLTPAISGIVIGITSMITTILTKLSTQVETITQNQGTEAIGTSMEIATLFGRGIPTFYFQVVVGIYVVQIIFILTILSNGIENGSDKLNERYNLGKNLIRSTFLYCFIAAAVMVLFNLISATILTGTL